MSINGTLIYENQRVPTRKFEIAAAVPMYTEVKITAARTVGKAAAGNFILGRVIALPLQYPGNCGVAVKYNFELTRTAGAAIAAGDRLKLGTDGTNGGQRFIPFVAGTDEPGLEIGIALTAAGVNEEFDGLFI
jgi:hypothetical protein